MGRGECPPGSIPRLTQGLTRANCEICRNTLVQNIQQEIGSGVCKIPIFCEFLGILRTVCGRLTHPGDMIQERQKRIG